MPSCAFKRTIVNIFQKTLGECLQISTFAIPIGTPLGVNQLGKLPDRLTAGQQILVLFVVVRIHLGQL